MICDSTISGSATKFKYRHGNKIQPKWNENPHFIHYRLRYNPYSANQIDDSSQIPITKELSHFMIICF